MTSTKDEPGAGVREHAAQSGDDRGRRVDDPCGPPARRAGGAPEGRGVPRARARDRSAGAACSGLDGTTRSAPSPSSTASSSGAARSRPRWASTAVPTSATPRRSPVEPTAIRHRFELADRVIRSWGSRSRRRRKSRLEAGACSKNSRRRCRPAGSTATGARAWEDLASRRTLRSERGGSARPRRGERGEERASQSRGRQRERLRAWVPCLATPPPPRVRARTARTGRGARRACYSPRSRCAMPCPRGPDPRARSAPPARPAS